MMEILPQFLKLSITKTYFARGKWTSKQYASVLIAIISKSCNYDSFVLYLCFSLIFSIYLNVDLFS